MTNFARSQLWKSTYVAFLSIPQSEHSLCSHSEMAAHSPSTAAWSICGGSCARLVTHQGTSTFTVSELVLLRQQLIPACQHTRSNFWADGKARPTADTFTHTTRPKWRLSLLLPHEPNCKYLFVMSCIIIADYSQLSHNSLHNIQGDKCWRCAVACLGGLPWAASCRTVLQTCHALVGQRSPGTKQQSDGLSSSALTYRQKSYEIMQRQYAEHMCNHR